MIVGAIIGYCIGALIIARAVLFLDRVLDERRQRRAFPRATTLTRRQRRNLRSMRADIRPAIARGRS